MNPTTINRSFFTNLAGTPTEVEVNTTIEIVFDCGLTARVNAAGFVTVSETGSTQGASQITFGWRFDGNKMVLAASPKSWLAKCYKKNYKMFGEFRFRDIQKVVDSIKIQ